MEHKYLKPIGEVAVFYLPKKKMDMELLHIRADNTPKFMIHNFFMLRHGAYTMEESDIIGYWESLGKESSGDIHAVNPKKIFAENNVRYEVSFKGKEKRDDFVDFLSELCAHMEEEAIYLTMGYKSYLVLPDKELQDEIRSIIS